MRLGALHAYEKRIILDAGNLSTNDAHRNLVSREFPRRCARLVAGHQGNRTDIWD